MIIHLVTSICMMCLFFPLSGHGMVPSNQKLDQLKIQMGQLEEQIVQSPNPQSAIKSLQKMISLGREQQVLVKKRVVELDHLIRDLDQNKSEIQDKVKARQSRVHRLLVELHRVRSRTPDAVLPPQTERIEAPKREVISALVRESLKETEELKIDLDDAQRISDQILIEKTELAQWAHEIIEQQNMLALSREVQVELLQRKQSQRWTQLKTLQAKRSARGQVDQLMGSLNARLELQRTIDEERRVSQELSASSFSKLRGKFLYPMKGTVVGAYGKTFDPESRMVVFKKGIEIMPQSDSTVRSIYEGKVAFSGQLPSYGQVLLIDHGNHFYSLLGRLGSIRKQKGDAVMTGEVIASALTDGTPIYFEIRAKNVALNPMQWLSQSTGESTL